MNYFKFLPLLLISITIVVGELSLSPEVVKLVRPLLESEEGIGPFGICVGYNNAGEGKLGYPVIGIGKKCSKEKVRRHSDAQRICQYLEELCTEYIAKEWFKADVYQTFEDMKSYDNIMEAYQVATDKRKAILISIAYQYDAYRLSKFTNMLKNISAKNWDGAVTEMLNSYWCRRDSTARVYRHAYVMKHDECNPNNYDDITDKSPCNNKKIASDKYESCKKYGWDKISNLDPLILQS